MEITKSPNKPSFPELRGSIETVKWPALVEIKYDGELNFFDHGKLVNKYGTTRNTFSAIANIPTNCVLMGELFTGEGKAGELYTLLSNKKNDDALTYVAFDILELDGVDLRRLSLEERLLKLETIGGSSLKDCTIAHNKEEALGYYKQIVDAGFEGAVIKSLSSMFITGPCSWVKIKNKDQSNYPVVLIDPVRERIEVDVAGVRVGVKCPNKYKGNVHLGDKVTIEHQGVLASGSLRHPVYIGV